MKLSTNQKALVTLVGAEDLVSAKTVVEQMGLTVPNRITADFLSQVEAYVVPKVQLQNEVVSGLEDDIVAGIDAYFAPKRELTQQAGEIVLSDIDKLTESMVSALKKKVRNSNAHNIMVQFKIKGKLVDAEFIGFDNPTVRIRRPYVIGKNVRKTFWFDEQNKVEDYNIERYNIMNVYGGVDEVRVSTRNIDDNDLRVKLYVPYLRKEILAPIQRVYVGNIPMLSLLATQPRTTEAPAVTAIMNEMSCTQFYHQQYGVGRLVPIRVDAQGYPVYFENDDMGRIKAMFTPEFENEISSVLPYAVTEDELTDLDEGSDVSATVDSARIREVYQAELMLIAEDGITYDSELATMPRINIDINKDRTGEKLYYSLGKIADMDGHGVITSTLTGLQELVYVVKDLPPIKRTVVKRVFDKSTGVSVKREVEVKMPQVLVIGEESKRLYVTNPYWLYSVAGEKGAELKDLRYKWTDPTTGTQVAVATNDILNYSQDFASEGIEEYYLGSYEPDAVAPQPEKPTAQATKEFTIQPEHIKKHGIKLPEMKYNVKLNYVPLVDGANIATISFEKNNVTYMVQFIYSAELKAVKPTPNWTVTEASKPVLDSMKTVVGQLWNKHRVQSQAQAQ